MPSKDSTATAAQGTLVLTGQGNWIRWYPAFRASARATDVWELFTGQETILPKPDRKAYTAAFTAAGPQVEDGDDNESLTSAAVAAKKATGVEVARRDFAYKQAVDDYKFDLHDYEQQREKIRRANELLGNRLEASIRSDIHDLINPQEALHHLMSLYKMQDSHALQIAHDGMAQLQLVKCASMNDYLSKVRQFKTDIRELGGSCDENSVIAKNHLRTSQAVR